MLIVLIIVLICRPEYKTKPKKRGDIQKWYLVKEGTNRGNFNIDLTYDAHINLVYSLVSHDPSTDVDPDMVALDKTVTVSFEKLYDSAKFHTYYEDKKADGSSKDMQLGMTYTPEATTFRVWSPVSANMTVLIYDKDTSKEFAPADAEDAVASGVDAAAEATSEIGSFFEGLFDAF